jgi:hypothetical protein
MSQGLATAVHRALIREILSSGVAARIGDLTALFLFGFVNARLSILNYSNQRQVGSGAGIVEPFGQRHRRD